MNQTANAESFRKILAELQEVLAQERRALERLDRASMEHLAERKLELDAQLRASAKISELGPVDLQALKRMRAAALSNQLLLVHARSCIRGIISLVTREQVPRHPGVEASTPPPVALSFRG